LSAATRTAYESNLNILVALATVRAKDTVFALTPALVRSYFVELSVKDLKLSTLHRRRASIAEFIRWGVRKRLWNADSLNEVPEIRKPKTLPRLFAEDERDRLMALTLPSEERLLRAMLYYTGLRVSAICEVRVADISTSKVVMAGLDWPGTIAR
jgi:site-specific recombinase XerD